MRNKVHLIGNLGADPEVFNFKDDRKKTSFTIATTDTYKKENGEKISETEWHNIVAWNGTAGIVEKYLKKGSKVALEGKLTTRSYDDKDGNKKYISEVVIHELVLLDPIKN